MKKRFFALFLTMALLLPAVLLSGCASADSGIMDTANLNATAAGGDSSLPVVTWKMGSVWGAGNVHFTVDQRFAELVSQLTDGRFIITNYSEGELCSASQLFDFVSQGTVECGGDWGGYWSGKDTAFELLSTIMDDFTALDYYTWIYEAGGMDCYKEMYGQYNMEYFPLVTNPSESGIRSVSPITSIEDMQHMKIRLGGVMAGKAAQKGKAALTGDSADLFEQLRALRMRLAQAEKLPPYLVFGDKTLVDMCAKAPRQLEDMKEIYGMGERKFAKYGKQFFAAIEDYRREHPEAEFTGA